MQYLIYHCSRWYVVDLPFSIFVRCVRHVAQALTDFTQPTERLAKWSLRSIELCWVMHKENLQLNGKEMSYRWSSAMCMRWLCILRAKLGRPKSKRWQNITDRQTTCQRRRIHRHRIAAISCSLYRAIWYGHRKAKKENTKCNWTVNKPSGKLKFRWWSHILQRRCQPAFQWQAGRADAQTTLLTYTNRGRKSEVFPDRRRCLIRPHKGFAIIAITSTRWRLVFCYRLYYSMLMQLAALALRNREKHKEKEREFCIHID